MRLAIEDYGNKPTTVRQMAQWEKMLAEINKLRREVEHLTDHNKTLTAETATVNARGDAWRRLYGADTDEINKLRREVEQERTARKRLASRLRLALRNSFITPFDDAALAASDELDEAVTP